jgi:hypothetical protein
MLIGFFHKVMNSGAKWIFKDMVLVSYTDESELPLVTYTP